MSKFMLLLYSDPTAWAKLPQDQAQTRVEKYSAWTTKPFTVASGRLAADVGRVLRSQNGKPQAVDGPYSETKEVLAGYYTIEAPNYDEAVKLALAHPHIEYGGTIEVRQVYGT